MKGAILTYNGLESKSGGYLYDRKLVEELQKNGHKIKDISLRKKDYLKNIGHNFSETVNKKIDTKELDFLLEDELMHNSLWETNRYLRNKKDLTLFSIVHHLGYLEKQSKTKKHLKKFFEKKYIETINNYIFNSELTKNTVKELKETKFDSIIAYPGKDHLSVPDSIKYKKENNKLNLVFLGNIVPNKNIHSVLKAIKEMNEIEFKVIGNKKIDPRYVNGLESLIKKLDLVKKVELTGYLSKKEKQKQLYSSDVFILPSYHEGYGISVIEALGFGLPTILTKNSGAKKLIEENKVGSLINPNDVKEIKETLNEFRKNNDKLIDMSKNAKEKYSELPSWEQNLTEAINFIENKAK